MSAGPIACLPPRTTATSPTSGRPPRGWPDWTVHLSGRCRPRGCGAGRAHLRGARRGLDLRRPARSSGAPRCCVSATSKPRSQWRGSSTSASSRSCLSLIARAASIDGDHSRAAAAAAAAITAASRHGWNESPWTAAAHAVLAHACLTRADPVGALDSCGRRDCGSRRPGRTRPSGSRCAAPAVGHCSTSATGPRGCSSCRRPTPSWAGGPSPFSWPRLPHCSSIERRCSSALPRPPPRP